MGEPVQVSLLASDETSSSRNIEPWADPADIANCVDDDKVDLRSVCDVATRILFELSGRRFGVRRETARPVAHDRYLGWVAAHMPANSAVWWDRWQSNYCGKERLRLKSPIRVIESIKIDGQTISPSTYTIYNNRDLERNGDTWPVWQRTDLGDDQVGTFSITYQYGASVPSDARTAAQTFACQLAKYLNRDSDCALPDRLVSMTRQGVSQTIMDPSQFIKEARTGLYLVDMWLSAVNPSGSRRRPRIASPDDIELLRVTKGSDT